MLAQPLFCLTVRSKQRGWDGQSNGLEPASTSSFVISEVDSVDA